MSTNIISKGSNNGTTVYIVKNTLGGTGVTFISKDMAYAYLSFLNNRAIISVEVNLTKINEKIGNKLKKIEILYQDKLNEINDLIQGKLDETGNLISDKINDKNKSKEDKLNEIDRLVTSKLEEIDRLIQQQLEIDGNDDGGGFKPF